MKTNKKTDKQQLFHKKQILRLCKRIEQEETEPRIPIFSPEFQNAKTKTKTKTFGIEKKNDQPLLNGYLCGSAKINEICKMIEQDLNSNEIEILAMIIPTLNKSDNKTQTIK
ncbi:hypothetical protein M0812_07390 [Anaeramoeba flamelloides]|uniref:Uncharacterized protein n=1 Tax=Anaeramoeba flamelloides TaxID=1746091 RepID=A0AAV8A3N3_9EUKA|nr:hypothetical protein M0812_07390 [Anaeramoeba flamelloides]